MHGRRNNIQITYCAERVTSRGDFTPDQVKRALDIQLKRSQMQKKDIRVTKEQKRVEKSRSTQVSLMKDSGLDSFQVQDAIVRQLIQSLGKDEALKVLEAEAKVVSYKLQIELAKNFGDFDPVQQERAIKSQLVKSLGANQAQQVLEAVAKNVSYKVQQELRINVGTMDFERQQAAIKQQLVQSVGFTKANQQLQLASTAASYMVQRELTQQVGLLSPSVQKKAIQVQLSRSNARKPIPDWQKALQQKLRGSLDSKAIQKQITQTENRKVPVSVPSSNGAADAAESPDPILQNGSVQPAPKGLPNFSSSAGQKAPDTMQKFGDNIIVETYSADLLQSMD